MNSCCKSASTEELNEILQGVLMGRQVFRDILEQAQNEKFRALLKQALEMFHHHETDLEVRIRCQEGTVDSGQGVMASLSETVEKIKTMMADSDRELLSSAIRAMDMAMKACELYRQKHPQISVQTETVIEELLKDYRKIYHELTEFRIGL